MAVVAFCVVGMLTALLIYFVLRAQTLQGELIKARSSAKTNARRASIGFTNLVLLCGELQKVYGQRLDAAQQKGLLSSAQSEVAGVIVRHFTQVVMDCCEKGLNVEESLTHALKHENVTLSEVKGFIKEQPGEVRLPWAKNTPQGFITACSNLTRSALTVEATDAKTATG